ncbi:MAG: chorismate-binding protein [Magnetococcales bacterium]|nr:chorismate-binding protein [Magnetococcales bacterium]
MSTSFDASIQALLRDSDPIPVTPLWLHEHRESVLLDFAPFAVPLLLTSPERLLTAYSSDQVTSVLSEAEKASEAGKWVAGWISYEASAAFGLPVFTSRSGTLTETGSPQLPLVWFAVYDSALPACLIPDSPPHSLSPPSSPFSCHLDLSRSGYVDALSKINDLILAGDSYQVNFTTRSRIHLDRGDPAQIFLDLQTRHRHPFGAWISQGNWTVTSFSPELFLARVGDDLESGPIKGTRPRQSDSTTDMAIRQELLSSEKDRAEHVMIVDMVRNDLGRVCQTGSVTTGDLISWRAFPSVHHLETRVRGRAHPGTKFSDQMQSLFPAASITGAPKHRTMEIIRELEQFPRGVYTGAIGAFLPGGDYLFNVAIRTVTWDGDHQATLGLGGGIVADSQTDAEWQELADKGRFMTETAPFSRETAPFQLIETMRVEADLSVVLLSEHTSRLHQSARALGFLFDAVRFQTLISEVVNTELATIMQGSALPFVLRITLDATGEMTWLTRPLPDPNPSLRLVISRTIIDNNERLLRYKISRRHHFDEALAEARTQGSDDALFVNKRSCVTETAIRGLAYRMEGKWFVPPLEDGLLKSLWRAQFIGESGAQERSLVLHDLEKVEAIVLGNAVQGTTPVSRITGVAGEILWKVSESSKDQELLS